VVYTNFLEFLVESLRKWISSKEKMARVSVNLALGSTKDSWIRWPMYRICQLTTSSRLQKKQERRSWKKQFKWFAISGGAQLVSTPRNSVLRVRKNMMAEMLIGPPSLPLTRELRARRLLPRDIKSRDLHLRNRVHELGFMASTSPNLRGELKIDQLV
jgi:hypothetical protein